MPPAGFEPAIPAREQTHTHILDRVVNGIVKGLTVVSKIHELYLYLLISFNEIRYCWLCN
jgi:hypothetical protein